MACTWNWNGLEWPGTTAMPNRCTKISAGTGTGPVTVTVPGPVTVTVPVPVTRLGALGSGCAFCDLLTDTVRLGVSKVG